MGVGYLRNVVVDCPDPVALARFYGELLGMPLVLPGVAGRRSVGPGG